MQVSAEIPRELRKKGQKSLELEKMEIERMGKTTVEIPAPTRQECDEVVALANIVNEYTYFPRHHGSVDETKPIGTAVMLGTAHRLFAITAKHCVHDDMALIYRIRSNEPATA